MKNVMKSLCYALLIVITFGILGCGGNKPQPAQQEKPKTAAEQAPAKKEDQQATQAPAKTEIQQATEPQEIEVDIVVGSIQNGKLPIDVTTNIIDGAVLMVTVNDQYIWREEHGIGANENISDALAVAMHKETYKAQSKKPVKDGKIHCEFSGNKLKPGDYDITVSMSVPKFQDDKRVPKFYGDNGEYLADGPNVRESSGKRSVSKTIRVEIQ